MGIEPQHPTQHLTQAAVSNIVPVPTTRARGNPEISAITDVKISTGLVTMTMVPP